MVIVFLSTVPRFTARGGEIEVIEGGWCGRAAPNAAAARFFCCAVLDDVLETMFVLISIIVTCMVVEVEQHGIALITAPVGDREGLEGVQIVGVLESLRR